MTCNCSLFIQHFLLYLQARCNFFDPTDELVSFNYALFDFNTTFAKIAWKQPRVCSGRTSYKVLMILREVIQIENENCSISENFYYINKSMLQVSHDDRYKFYVSACCNGMEYSTDFSLAIPPEGKLIFMMWLCFHTISVSNIILCLVGLNWHFFCWY